ncbi:MAG: helix-turn-helix domain-containing protein [Kofleriaceae bacterium]
MTSREPSVVAVGGGKGGVGKSLIAANLGIFLATLGKKVVVVDASLGAPNLHLFCGVPRPTRTLSEALVGGGVALTDLAVTTPVPGMRLIGGAADPAWVADVDLAAAQDLLAAVRELPCDWVVLDLAGGMSAVVLELFLGADVGLVAAVPDPTSVELMHRFIGAAFLHRLRQHGLAELADLHGAPKAGIVGPLEIYLDAVGREHPYLDHLRAAILGFAPQLVINAARSKHDMELGRAITSAAHRRLGVPIGYLGHLEYDEAVWASTRRRRPLLVEHPEARITKCIEKVTRNLLAVRPPHLDVELLPSDAHYDLLEVAPSASFEDIRRANRRIRDVYGAESIAIAGLYDPASLEAVHRRLDLAYTTLMDAAKRKEYDAELFPDGIPTPTTAVPVAVAIDPVRDRVASATRPPMPEVGPRTEWSGPLLRQVREALGIELRELSERTKIGMAYLAALEDEHWAKLPAPVYVRGFLVEYARILGLDAVRLKDTYLERYRAGRGLPPEATRDGDSGPVRRRSRTETAD